MPTWFSFILIIPFLCANQDEISNPHADAETIKIAAFSKSAIAFCKHHNYNSSVFFLVDMNIHSGKKRFFVVDMNTDSVLTAGLVAHGACGIFFSATASFSNEQAFIAARWEDIRLVISTQEGLDSHTNYLDLIARIQMLLKDMLFCIAITKCLTRKFTRATFAIARVAPWYQKIF